MVMLAGLFSVLSLLVSLSLPHWLVTVDSLDSLPRQLELHIGLFSVCPHLEVEDRLSNLTTSPGAGLECSSIGESRAGLWPPVSRTARLLTRIRSVTLHILIGTFYWSLQNVSGNSSE